MTLEQLHSTPGWLNWTIISSTWLVSFLQPLALVLTVVYAALQIYGWFEKRRKRK